jgi:hypothetical protein
MPVVKLNAKVGRHPGSGHGECFIWSRSLDKSVVAVDAGGAHAVGRAGGAQKPSILILSHDDNDHIGGAVSLILAAGSALKELWVPAEWAVLIKQIADSDGNNPVPNSAGSIDLEGLIESVAEQLVTVDNGTERPNDVEGSFLIDQLLLSRATETLGRWDITGSDFSRFTLSQGPNVLRVFYGARGLTEILKRVRNRAKALIDIFNVALDNSVKIRFFSIDLALSRQSKEWETAGRPGVVTLANASEVPYSMSIYVPPGLLHAYALTSITVQNRRALCTLLWSNSASPTGGQMIWSDSDGNWLDHSAPLGLGQVIATLTISSAPHHASANSSHDRIWAELAHAPSSLVMICAGGRSNQGYRNEYLRKKRQRCCTWCRPTSTHYQDVGAQVQTSGQASLLVSCFLSH